MNKFIKWFLLCVMMSSTILVGCKKEEEDVDNIFRAQQNKEAGEKFLKEKEAESGIQKDPSGLLYQILTNASGEKPRAKDTVCIHYDGFTIKGKQFISQADTISMENLEEGLRIGLRHMNQGSKYKFYIPYYLMYGASAKKYTFEEDTVNVLEYSALVYEMKLDSIIFVK